jgi:epoxyqueuosine reductase
VRSREAKLAARDDLEAPELAKLAMLDEHEFRQRFAGGPIKRIGRARFLRNVLIAIGNSGDQRLIAVARSRLVDESPLVRGMAVWAFAQLCSKEAFSAQTASAAEQEQDRDVQTEWRAALRLNLPASPAPTV